MVANMDQSPLTCALFGELAQLGERLLCKQNVIGSIPVFSTKFPVLVDTISQLKAVVL